MLINSVTLHSIVMPLRTPFTTSFSTQTQRDSFIVEVQGTSQGREVTGWGECVALADPLYSPEYLDGAREVIRRWIVPTLSAWQRDREITAQTVGHALGRIVGHRMAKAAVEMAVLDAELRGEQRSLASWFGAVVDSVPSGVSVGIQDSIPRLIETVGGYLSEGYVRIKLKVKPGWDIAPVRAVRKEFGDDILLQVDANTAYTLQDAAHLRKLDEFGLLLIEQPLGEEDLRQHAKLARLLDTPLCLDESIVSAQSAADAIALDAMSVINIKPGRVGGYLEAKRIHDIASANGIAVWCGGMLETGLGRAANIALAALPGFTLPGDISASNRFYELDLTEPIVMKDGYVTVPTGPGIGVDPIPEVLREVTTGHEELILG
jgi:O-succinylbenzoate synthase